MRWREQLDTLQREYRRWAPRLLSGVLLAVLPLAVWVALRAGYRTEAVLFALLGALAVLLTTGPRWFRAGRASTPPGVPELPPVAHTPPIVPWRADEPESDRHR